MIILHQPAPMFELPSFSPFCLKLEAFLRWQSIEFKTIQTLPFKGPYKKIPFVEYQNKTLGDSSQIINQLINDTHLEYSKDLNLSIGHSFSKMMEEHIYWVMVYFRWVPKHSWLILKEAFFKDVPMLIRPIITGLSLKEAKRTLYGQGIGRLPESMILDKAKQDLIALDNQLSKSKYICGDKLTHYDLSIWAVLSQFMQSNFDIPLTQITLELSNLQSYLQRVNTQLAPKWQDFSGSRIFQRV